MIKLFNHPYLSVVVSIEQIKIRCPIFRFYPESYELLIPAGLLACSFFAAFPPAGWRTVASMEKNKELTATGIAPDFHRIPYYPS
jgi:hypothetical protein